MDSVVISAPAKVNAVLRVVGRRADGFHDLQMVMVPLTLSDSIEISSIPSGIELDIDGQADEGMRAQGNLAWKAAALMRDAAGHSDGVRIRLTKRIPVAAGLGGGSSDAAAVLRGLSRLWNLGWKPQRLAELGKRLGADVPFFCYDGPAFVEGIGDRVMPYEKFPSLLFLLINPGFSVSTPWVYQQWDLQLTPKGADARVRQLFQDFRDVIASLRNDLEAVTVPAYPEIVQIKKFLIDSGAAGALMSGSGPTVFGIFEGRSERDAALERAKACSRWRCFAADGMTPPSQAK